jgi:hypothetical protein
MNRIVCDMEQGTPEWFAARLGRVTCSQLSTVMASGRGGGESKTRRKYMLQLIGEILTGEKAGSYSNGHMDRGHIMEIEARDLYQLTTGNEVNQVGFVQLGDHVGGSPDGLVGDRGAIEIKSAEPHIHLETLLRGSVPTEHIPQCQGLLYVLDREWIDFISYWPSLPIFIKRVQRDSAVITKIRVAIDSFMEELVDITEQIKRIGD